MTVRTVGNQTIRSTKRHVTCAAFEVMALDGSTFEGEFHPNLLSYGSPVDETPWFYPGYEHIPFGTDQSGLVGA